MTFSDPFTQFTKQVMESLAEQMKSGWFDEHGTWHKPSDHAVTQQHITIERVDIEECGNHYNLHLLLADERQFIQSFPKAEHNPCTVGTVRVQ